MGKPSGEAKDTIRSIPVDLVRKALQLLSPMPDA
jgi:hypothetical protein